MHRKWGKNEIPICCIFKIFINYAMSHAMRFVSGKCSSYSNDCKMCTQTHTHTRFNTQTMNFEYGSNRRRWPHEMFESDGPQSQSRAHGISVKSRSFRKGREENTRCANERAAHFVCSECARTRSHTYTLIPPYYNFHGGHQSSSFVSADSPVA